MQIFHHSTNTIAKVSIFGGLFIVAASLWVLAEVNRSSYNTGQFIEAPAARPVLAQAPRRRRRHRLPLLPHLGRDVEHGRDAADQDLHELPLADLVGEPVPGDRPRRATARTSPSSGRASTTCPTTSTSTTASTSPRASGCASCHGRVDEMPAVYQAASLQMEWCLACHRAPERFLRPKEEIYNMGWNIEADAERRRDGRPENRSARTSRRGVERRARLLKTYQRARGRQITSCSTCHR